MKKNLFFKKLLGRVLFNNNFIKNFFLFEFFYNLNFNKKSYFYFVIIYKLYFFFLKSGYNTFSKKKCLFILKKKYVRPFLFNYYSKKNNNSHSIFKIAKSKYCKSLSYWKIKKNFKTINSYFKKMETATFFFFNFESINIFYNYSFRFFKYHKNTQQNNTNNDKEINKTLLAKNYFELYNFQKLKINVLDKFFGKNLVNLQKKNRCSNIFLFSAKTATSVATANIAPEAVPTGGEQVKNKTLTISSSVNQISISYFFKLRKIKKKFFSYNFSYKKNCSSKKEQCHLFFPRFNILNKIKILLKKYFFFRLKYLTIKSKIQFFKKYVFLISSIPFQNRQIYRFLYFLLFLQFTFEQKKKFILLKSVDFNKKFKVHSYFFKILSSYEKVKILSIKLKFSNYFNFIDKILKYQLLRNNINLYKINNSSFRPQSKNKILQTNILKFLNYYGAPKLFSWKPKIVHINIIKFLFLVNYSKKKRISIERNYKKNLFLFNVSTPGSALFKKLNHFLFIFLFQWAKKQHKNNKNLWIFSAYWVFIQPLSYFYKNEVFFQRNLAILPPCFSPPSRVCQTVAGLDRAKPSVESGGLNKNFLNKSLIKNLCFQYKIFNFNSPKKKVNIQKLQQKKIIYFLKIGVPKINYIFFYNLFYNYHDSLTKNSKNVIQIVDFPFLKKNNIILNKKVKLKLKTYYFQKYSLSFLPMKKNLIKKKTSMWFYNKQKLIYAILKKLIVRKKLRVCCQILKKIGSYSYNFYNINLFLYFLNEEF